MPGDKPFYNLRSSHSFLSDLHNSGFKNLGLSRLAERLDISVLQALAACTSLRARICLLQVCMSSVAGTSEMRQETLDSSAPADIMSHVLVFFHNCLIFFTRLLHSIIMLLSSVRSIRLHHAFSHNCDTALVRFMRVSNEWNSDSAYPF